MSGGFFDYKQYNLEYIADEIKQVILNNDIKDQYGYSNHYSPETLAKFSIAIDKLLEAQVYVKRIDWLVSGDDGEESFHKRLQQELEELLKK